MRRRGRRGGGPPRPSSLPLALSAATVLHLLLSFSRQRKPPPVCEAFVVPSSPSPSHRHDRLLLPVTHQSPRAGQAAAEFLLRPDHFSARRRRRQYRDDAGRGSATHDRLGIGRHCHTSNGQLAAARPGDAPAPAAAASGPPTLIAVDVENVRGHSHFALPHSALLSRAAAWRLSRSGTEAIAMVVDHGSRRCAHVGGPLSDGLGVLFAGMGCTADDCIVSLVGERCSGGGGGGGGANNSTTVIVTADAQLITRCQRQRRESASSSSSGGGNWTSDVVFVEPASFLRELERHSYADDDLFSGLAFDFPDDGGGDDDDESSEGAEEEAVAIDDAAQAGEYAAHDGDAGDDVSANFDGTRVNGEVNGEASSNGEDEDDEEDIVDAFMKQSAVERTLQARRRLVRDFNSKLKPGGAKGGRKGKRGKNRLQGQDRGSNRMSGKQRNKLLARQRRAQRHADLAGATRTRKVLAEEFRKRLEAAGTDHTGTRPVRKLLEWLAAPIDVGRTADGGGVTTAAASLNVGLLSWSAGADDNLNDPLSSVLTVPRRREPGPIVSQTHNIDDDGSGGRPKPFLRLVVISDTHGFEGGLARLPRPDLAPVPHAWADGVVDGEEENDDAKKTTTKKKKKKKKNAESAPHLLPKADVLVHCGDFAANGSRMRQRESIRRLDNFLAAQEHIPTKIVVRGNHDPQTSGRKLFPKSRALYATSPSKLSIDGVVFALEPFSRRAAPPGGRALESVRNCDVLVSHEPPRGVLDLTYSGLRIGSSLLRRSVEMSPTKPRCWLCGHVHEGRGAARELFGAAPAAAAAPLQRKEAAREEVEGEGEGSGVGGGGETTLVVNAANANCGKANRLVAGSIIVDVEREATAVVDGRTVNGEGTKLTMVDAFPKAIDPRDDLGLEPAQVRPGVRRRKGLAAASRRRPGAGARR